MRIVSARWFVISGLWMNAAAAIWRHISAIRTRGNAGFAIIAFVRGGACRLDLLREQLLDLIFQVLEPLNQFREVLADHLTAKRARIVVSGAARYGAP